MISLLLAIATFVIKNRKPSTVPAGKGLLVDKAWLTTNQHPPRYADFTPAVIKLARVNEGFIEIAGNKGAIMLTVLNNKPLNSNSNYKVLFTQPIITKPGLSRIAMVTTVGNLSTTVKTLLDDNVTIEYIYDY